MPGIRIAASKRPAAAPLTLALAALAITGCTPAAADPRQTEIMDRIESKLQLPPGASPLASYARTYAYGPGDRVIGHYFRPQGHQTADSFCESTRRYGPDNGQIALACPPPDGMSAGQRRWYRKPEMLPDVDDGGCAFVDVEFDLKTGTVISAACHGFA